jgi:hypothetical protein
MPGVDFCHGSVLAEPDQTDPEGGGDFPEDHEQAVNGGDYAAVFGVGNADSTLDFQNWKIGNFGDTANLSATATDTAAAYTAVFGAGSVPTANFSDWQIGNFGAGLD